MEKGPLNLTLAEVHFVAGLSECLLFASVTGARRRPPLRYMERSDALRLTRWASHAREASHDPASRRP